MKILLTGGAGFIGSNVADAYLTAGYEVAIVDNLSTGKEENINPKAKFYNIDLLDIETLELAFREFKPEIVNHHAAQKDVRKSLEDPAFDAETNIIGSINLFELSINYGVKRIIFSSTGGALYGEPKSLPANENTNIEPLAPYGVAKYSVENYINYFKRLYGIERIILRYANVYGPRQDPLGEAGVVAIFIGKILKNEIPIIYGDGNQTRDYIYVGDVVKANTLALESKEGTYNIGTGVETSLNELMRIFSKVLGVEINCEYTSSRKGEVYRICLDGELAKKELGFEPEYTAEEGIRKTFDWFRKK